MGFAKGLTSGYVPLGAVVFNDEINSYFDHHTLWTGLTYSAHPVGCAAAIANLDVYPSENLIARARESGKRLHAGLVDLAEKHPSVGDVRGVGLLQLIELVASRGTRLPLSGFNQPPSEAMRAVSAALRARGLSTFVRWNMIFCTPPLIIDEQQVREGLGILDEALTTADRFAEAD